MPKPSLKNPFARRRSSGNVLDIDTTIDAPAATQSSFRVIERPEKNTINFDGPDRGNRASHVPRPFSSPLHQLRGKSADDLTYHANGSVDTAASRKAASASQPGRGSGGTTNSASSEFYQSSSASGRYSSSSTLPSSIEHENEDDELFTQKRAPPLPPPPTAHQALPTRLDDPLPPPPSFSARAQRAFSFGLRNKQSQDRAEPASSAGTAAAFVPPKPPALSHSPTRERALTTSSYASTAVPTIADIKPDLGTSDFGGDFASMFETASKSPIAGTYHTDSEPLFPPRSYNRQDSTPSPASLRQSRKNSDFPWERRDSRDGLLASAATSPNLATESTPTFSAQTGNGYTRVAGVSPTVERAAEVSQDTARSSSKTYELQDAQDTRMLPLSKVATAPTLRLPTDSISPFAKEGSLSEQDSSDATIKASQRASYILDDEPLFDASPNGPASRARRPDALHSKSESAAPRRLTKAQFEILQRYTDGVADSGDGCDSGNEYDDDDEHERTKQVTERRRKQEANMSVYRQQMKKVTGGGPTDLPNRPGLDTRTSSATSLHVGGVAGTPPVDIFQARQTDDDDDDIPLGILQAHGFPSGNRPPTRLGDSYRPPSGAPQRASQQSLPPFARRLPQDPYFGAGLVNPSARESLAFGGGGGSVYGGPAAPPTPGGLVGIIASEEQQRQARRGSPNPLTGTYNSMPLPSNMAIMNPSSPMGNFQVPGGYQHMQGMPLMPPMPMTNDPQLQEFMQMQMQFMQNMQAVLMQQAQVQPQQLSAPADLPRSTSSVPNLLAVPGAPYDQGRAMSMMGQPVGWNAGVASKPTSAFDPRLSTYAPSISGLAGPGTGYQPSIAPSERSNVGMPSRYRPVQSGEDGRTNSFTSSLTLNALSGQQTAPGERPVSQAGGQLKSTIRIVDKAKGMPQLPGRQAEPEEDEEGSWADMVKKKIRSNRPDRASKSGAERVALSELYPNVE